MDPDSEDQYHVQKQLHTFAGTFPEGIATRAFPMRLHCVFSCVDEVEEEKIAGHQAKFQNQLSDLRPQIVHGFQLKWDASIHPDLFVEGDPATAWQAVEKLFSTVHCQVGSRDAMSQEIPGNEPQPEEDINGRWIDERFGPDSSGCISMPTLL